MSNDAAGRIRAILDARPQVDDRESGDIILTVPDPDRSRGRWLHLIGADLRAVLDERDDDLAVLAAFLLPTRRPIEHWLAILANHFGPRVNHLLDDDTRFAAARARVDGAQAERDVSAQASTEWDLGVDSIGRNALKALTAAGITPADAAAMAPEDLALTPGLGKTRLERVRERLDRITDAADERA